MIERRISPRQRVFREANVHCPRGIYLSCHVRDMSRNGTRIRLATARVLPKEINFEIASLELRQTARVSWQMGKEAGIEFTGAFPANGCIPPPKPPEPW
jgi:hypothetical protein